MRPSSILLVCALFTLSSAKAQSKPQGNTQTTTCPLQPVTLEAMRDCYRPLVLFAPSANDTRLAGQLAALRGRSADLSERNVIVVIDIADHSTLQKASLAGVPTVEAAPFESAKLRSRFQVSQGSFVVLLVGKDGGEKFRQQNVLTVDTLNHIIDAMPMRQAEQNH